MSVVAGAGAEQAAVRRKIVQRVRRMQGPGERRRNIAMWTNIPHLREGDDCNNRVYEKAEKDRKVERACRRMPPAEEESSGADRKIEEKPCDKTGRVCRGDQRAEYVQASVDKDDRAEDSGEPGEPRSEYGSNCETEEERPDDGVEHDEASRGDRRADRQSGPRCKAFTSPPLLGEMKEVADREEKEPPGPAILH